MASSLFLVAGTTTKSEMKKNSFLAMKKFVMSRVGAVLALSLWLAPAAQAETLTVTGTDLNHISNGQFVYTVDGVGTFVIAGEKAVSYGTVTVFFKKQDRLFMPTGTYSLTWTAAEGKKIRVNTASLTGASSGIGSTLNFGTGSVWFLADKAGATYTTSTGTVNTFDPLPIEVITSQVNIKTLTIEYEVLDYWSEAELSDQEAYPTGQHVYCDRLTLLRSFKQGWNTVCLPFALDPAQLGEGTVAQQFESYDADKGLTFGFAEVMQPHRPYLVFCPEEVPAGLVLEDVELVPGEPEAVTQGGLTFRGNYEPALSMAGKYGVVNVDGTDRIRKGSSTSFLNSLRAYFEAKPGVEVKASTLLLADGTTTALSTVADKAQPAPLSAPYNVYTLTGTLVRQGAASLDGLPRGLYVVNGRKVAVR